MEPVEINAGSWYLRALRADDRIDDRPAVLAAFRDPQIRRRHPQPPATESDADAYVRLCAQKWRHDAGCTWAVCEPTTGEMLGEIELADLDLAAATADARCWALPAARGRGMTTTALSAVLRFASAGLGLQRVTCAVAENDAASAQVASKCGFRPAADRPSTWVLDGHQGVPVARQPATDS